VDSDLRGIYSVLPTPFNVSGEIDFAGLKSVIDLYIGAGVDGLTALGVTSETARLSDSERLNMMDTILEYVNKRLPVIIGTTTEGLTTCLELTRKAKALSAAAVMISPPRMAKLNSEAVVRHFRSVAEAVEIPIVIQDYPPISGFTMEASLLARIAREIPRARTIKLEDPPTPLKIVRVLESAEGTPVTILGGLGGMYFLEELLAGAAGAMTGFAIPEILVKVFQLFKTGETDKAADYFYRNAALMRFEFQEGIGLAIRKEILRRRGAITHSVIRPPGPALDASTGKALDLLLNWFQKQNTDIVWA
jgi:4-hydroxy-tetrahydrodipicolinate synthase